MLNPERLKPYDGKLSIPFTGPYPEFIMFEDDEPVEGQGKYILVRLTRHAVMGFPIPISQQDMRFAIVSVDYYEELNDIAHAAAAELRDMAYDQPARYVQLEDRTRKLGVFMQQLINPDNN